MTETEILKIAEEMVGGEVPTPLQHLLCDTNRMLLKVNTSIRSRQVIASIIALWQRLR